MISYFSELRYKEVIDIHSGRRLGYVCDAEFDECEGRLISLITPGRAKLFGLLGREDDYILPWKCIAKIGGDIILVELEADQPRRHREKRKIFKQNGKKLLKFQNKSGIISRHFARERTFFHVAAAWPRLGKGDDTPGGKNKIRRKKQCQ